ncbi:hypothetical protein [Runella slithyformis]|uniref:Lipocalin-like domain-containing protein n=1 Tax=Runella slithyformis (strain ATCC 29530 / DSM 19594 / LMG 11500 / NCIMB 11436 / LSU 4) TaxID=761193 RepID=A0A7U3ZNA6_RUNSL|nr:hypothetical protein [Runella slithyformis]AEI50365.1 hypothetical protein Runsl_4012 [Runella slithyformis DSM 19594]
MKYLICSFVLLISLLSCNPCKVSPQEEQKYLPFKYAVWSKTLEIDQNGNSKAYNGPTELFVRQWYGWTLTNPQKELDSVFIYRANQLVFKDRVATSSTNCGEVRKVQLSLDGNKHLSLELFIDDKGNVFSIEASEFVNSISELSKVNKGRYTFLRSKF